MNSSTNEYFRARHDMTGPVFREVLLQVKEERVNWRESEGKKKAVGRLWYTMNNQVQMA